MELSVPLVPDFDVAGDGAAPAWNQVAWVPLQRVGAGEAPHATRAKVLYSREALYLLFDCEDRRLTCTLTEDYANIFTEDVIEVFLWPEEGHELYFEYEISPLGVQLPILVPNHRGRFHGWLPWHYEEPRRIRARTAVRGGAQAPLAEVSGWSVEVRIPFALLVGLGNTPPVCGTRWRANLYRIDYDLGPATQWAWCPDTGTNFHDFRRFGTLLFA